MRADLNRLDLVLTLERDPGLDQVLGEYSTGGEVFVILFELVDDGAQRGRCLRDVLGLLRGKLVEILVDGLVRLCLLYTSDAADE